MPTRILSAHKFTKIPYDGPRRTDIELNVQSSAPVNIYGVSAIFLENFRENRTTDLFRYMNKSDFTKRLKLNVEGDEWYLIIENKNEKDVAIHYEVFDV